jgi:hypothetical protein
MICYHNLGEIAHDVVTACPVRIGIKKRARCCDYWDLVVCSGSWLKWYVPLGMTCA